MRWRTATRKFKTPISAAATPIWDRSRRLGRARNRSGSRLAVRSSAPAASTKTAAPRCSNSTPRRDRILPPPRRRVAWPPLFNVVIPGLTRGSHVDGRVPPAIIPSPMTVTHAGDSQGEADVIHRGKREGVCHGWCDWGSRGITTRRDCASWRSGLWIQSVRRAPVDSLAAIYDGGSSQRGGQDRRVGLQTVRDMGLAFNARGPAGLINGKAPGNAPYPHRRTRQALLEIVEERPDPGGSRWWCAGVVRSGAMGVWTNSAFRSASRR